CYQLILFPGLSIPILFSQYSIFSFFTDTPPSEFYTLSLHDALPICFDLHLAVEEYFLIIELKTATLFAIAAELGAKLNNAAAPQDRKSTRLNSSHEWISYAVFCLKKKKKKNKELIQQHTIQQQNILK